MRVFTVMLVIFSLWPFSSHASDGVQAQYIERPELALAKRIEMIRNAKESIDIETFSVNAEDSSARIIMSEILKKTNEAKAKGKPFRVRIMTDDYYNWRWNPTFPLAEYADELEKQGVQFKVFNKIDLILPSRANKRDHRKIMAIDGKEVLVGGRNISDNFYGLSEGFNFKDTDFWVKGDEVKGLADSINMFWNSDFSKKPQGDGKKSTPEDEAQKKARVDAAFTLNDGDKILLGKMEELIAKKEGREIHQCPSFSFATDEDPDGWMERKVNKVLIERLKKAEKKVVISNYLFLPLYELKETFEELSQRMNFDVDVLTNSYSAYPTEGESNFIGDAVGRRVERFGKNYFNIYLHDSARASDKWMAEKGAPKDAILHHKNMVIDDKTVIGGSYNLHPRSKYADSEVLIFFENCPSLAKDVESHIRQLMSEGQKWDRYHKDAFYCSSKKKGPIGPLKQLRDYLISEMAIQFF